jgi:hypothetical protein
MSTTTGPGWAVLLVWLWAVGGAFRTARCVVADHRLEICVRRAAWLHAAVPRNAVA